MNVGNYMPNVKYFMHIQDENKFNNIWDIYLYNNGVLAMTTPI